MHSVSPFILSLPPSSAPRVPHAPHLPLSAPKPVEATVTTAPRDSRKARLPGRGRPCGGPAALGRGESARGPAWGRGRQQSRGARCQDRSGQPPQLGPPRPGGDVTGGRAGGRGSLGRPRSAIPETSGATRGEPEVRGVANPSPRPPRSGSGYTSSAAGSGYFGLVSAGSGGSWGFATWSRIPPCPAEGLGEGHLRPPSAAWLCHVPAPIPQTLFRPKGQRWD